MSTNKEWEKNNPEKMAEYKRAWKVRNREKMLAGKAAYYLKTKEKHNADRKARYAENREIELKKAAEWSKKERIDNPEKVHELDKIYYANRRARKKFIGGEISKNRVSKLMELQKGRCACCKVMLKDSGHHLDHHMPLFLGGNNSDENTQLLCPSCNLSKSAKHPVDFMQQRGFLL